MAGFDERRPERTTSQIAVVAPDGSGSRTLTAGVGLRFQPEWSPDGSRIAYTTLAPVMVQAPRRLTSRVHIVNVDGSGDLELRLGSARDTVATYPVWSPDGSRLLVTSVRNVATQNPDSDFYLVNRDGSSAQVITDVDGLNSAPVWSQR